MNTKNYFDALDQAKELKLTYSQLENTLNTVDKPAGADYMAANMDTHGVKLEHEDNHHHLDGDHEESHSTEHDDHTLGHDGDHDHGDEGHH